MQADDMAQHWQAALQSFSSARLHETETHCRRLLAVDPQHANALHLLGVVAHRAGHLDDAIGLVSNAVAIEPSVAEFHSNLAVMQCAATRFDEAIASCRRALALNANLVDAHYNLGNALLATDAFDDAIASYRQAIALRVNSPQAHNNLGNALKATVRLNESIAAYRQALFFVPDYAQARSNLAGALEASGHLDAAIAELRRAVDAAPDVPAIHSNLILALQAHPDTDADAIAREAARWNDRHAEPLAPLARPATNDRSPERPLRVGYVSADLRAHPVASFLLPLLVAHDRRAVHSVCYSTGTQRDAVSERLRAASDRWVDLASTSDGVAAERIRADGIDVLVDLGGHTNGHRLQLFARRLAPVQVTWLGCPGTTGLTAFDARFVDAVMAPVGQDEPTSEPLVRLGPGAWCFDPPSDAPDVSTSPAARDGHVTFGAFADRRKITSPTLAAWARLLHRVPDSRLVLKARAYRDAGVVDALLRFFGERGIGRDRIETRADDPTRAAYLAHYASIDIALDTFPYHGTTTTCESLWMGVPVVTRAGDRDASRVGVSLLTTVGLDDWIATGEDDYVTRAARAAADVPSLVALRASLRARLRQSPLLDAPRFARAVEAAYRDRWRAWCSGTR